MAGFAVGVAVGSCSADAFICENNEGCAGLDDAVCEPNGYCSIPDSECHSGRRYAPGSGPLSDRCVPQEGSTGLPEGTTSTADDATSTGPPPPLDDSSEGTSGGASTSSTDPTDPTDPTDSTDSTDPTGDPVFEPCEGPLLLLDDFEQPVVDLESWDQGFLGDIEFTPLDGALTAQIPDMSLDRVAYSWITTLSPNPSLGAVGMEVLEVPDPMVAGEIYLFVHDDQTNYGISIYGGDLETFENLGMYSVRTTQPFDPVAHRWLRLTFDDPVGYLAWEGSPDGVQWLVIDEEQQFPAEWSFASTSLQIGSGVWEGPAAPQTLAVVDHAFVCAQ